MSQAEFVIYCWEFCGEFFDHALTHPQLEAACLLRSLHPAFCGDSVDREAVRDLILSAMGKT